MVVLPRSIATVTSTFIIWNCVLGHGSCITTTKIWIIFDIMTVHLVYHQYYQQKSPEIMFYAISILLIDAKCVQYDLVRTKRIFDLIFNDKTRYNSIFCNIIMTFILSDILSVLSYININTIIVLISSVSVNGKTQFQLFMECIKRWLL